MFASPIRAGAAIIIGMPALAAMLALAACSGGGNLPSTAGVATQSTATSTAPSIAWSPGPTTFDYGTLSGGTSSQTFTLKNSGGTSTGALTISLSGSAAFTKTADSCSATALGPKKLCSVTVQYAPTGTESDTATLAASSKKAGASITLTGSGVTSPQKFSYTHGSQTFVVPLGVTQITVTAVGARGSGPSGGEDDGGFGEVVVATLPVTSGTSLDVEVGGAGNSIFGGYNGGATGAGIGGGASDIRTTAADLTTRLIVAGGGGANSGSVGAGEAPGGNAGFSTGSLGGTSGTGATGGSGGGQNCSPCAAGGTGGGNSGGGNGGNGALGIGGSGGGAAEGGGGGGGYYGGGGGGFYSNLNNETETSGYGGGGGGSSFVEATATGVSSSQATSGKCDTNDNGCITISW